MALAGRLARCAAIGVCAFPIISGIGGCDRRFEFTEHVSYDSTIGIHGTLDFYEPRSDADRGNRPAVLAIHGGAWRGGDKAWGESPPYRVPFGNPPFALISRICRMCRCECVEIIRNH